MTAADWGPDSPADDKPARAVRPNTCGGCDARWHGTRVAHCAARNCHRTFAGVGLFDLHRTADDRCLHPDDVRGWDGKPRLWFRDGMWRGPEATEEQRAALREIAS